MKIIVLPVVGIEHRVASAQSVNDNQLTTIVVTMESFVEDAI